MVEDAGTGHAAEVPAQVVALRPVQLGERAHRAPCQAVDLERLLVLELPVLAHVPRGRDHQVPRDVRELVQKHERQLAAVHDQRLVVLTLERPTEDAPRRLVGGRDVFEAPGRPEPLH